MRFLLPGKYELNSSSTPPIGYASLDLLKRAETTGGAIATDVLLFGTTNQHIIMIERVTNKGGELMGLIHLGLDVALFKQILTSMNLIDTFVELRQSISERLLVLSNLGEADDPQLTSVNGTRWSIAYWQGNGGVVKAGGIDSSSSSLTPILLVALLVVGAAGLVLLRRSRSVGGTSKQAQDSGVVYAGAIHAIKQGAYPGFEKLIPGLASNDGSQEAQREISQGMVGDCVTMIASTEDLKAAAANEAVIEPNAVSSEQINEPEENLKSSQISPSIFRSYDIRGIVEEDLGAEVVEKIGHAIGSEAAARNQKTVIIGRDGRNSGSELSEALCQGLVASGRDVIDIGMVPTPVLYFATHFLETNSGVMLTGSHNGPEYNGLKIVLDDETLSEDAIQSLYRRIEEGDLETDQGSIQTQDITGDYVRRISEDIPAALGGAFKIVVDCGNGITGNLAPQLYRDLGHDIVELFCEVDGNFPNHHPDPSQPDNLQALIDKVKEEQADLGFAFDGDGDRLGVVDGEGNIIWPDRQLMLLAKDVLSRNHGANIIYDVKCSRHLRSIVESNGGTALMWKTGHSLIKKKMKEMDAPLAGEMSGHIFFKERWYGFDDAMYTGARVLEVLMAAKVKPVEAFAEIPAGVSTPELRIELNEELHQAFMQDLGAKISFEGTEVFDTDGFRVEFSDRWGLVRPSNTSPYLVLRFEADDQAALDRIKSDFGELILSINPDLSLPF